MLVSEEEAIQLLNKGKVIGIPTDTVYGFAVLEKSKEKVYKLKNRDINKKLITFISSVEHLGKLDDFSEIEIQDITKKYWPGDNTLVFKQNNEFISYRITKEENIVSLLNKLKKNILTTSANISGESAIVLEEEFLEKFPDIPLLAQKIKTKASGMPSKIYLIEKKKKERIR